MNDSELAIAVVHKGAEVVRRHFGSALQRLDKQAGDFATNADIEAEKAMLSLLMAERPDDSVLGEESGQSGAASNGRTWLVDPLCGTLNYAVRMGIVGVNTALKNGSWLTAAAVADPFNQETFWTDGRAAFLRRGDEDSRLVPNAGSQLVDLNFDPPFPNAPQFRAVALAADPDFAVRFRARVVSTSLALTWVASGQRAAYITDGDVRDSVHFSAGIAICEAAGCTVTDLKGAPWGHAATGLIAAADRGTHSAIVELARRLLAG